MSSLPQHFHVAQFEPEILMQLRTEALCPEQEPDLMLWNWSEQRA